MNTSSICAFRAPSLRAASALALVALLSSFVAQSSFAAPKAGVGGDAPPTADGRIPIGPDTTPGDGGTLYKITQPGSYYLAANVLGVPGKHGIQITIGDVTLDLNGMVVMGDGENTLQGIQVNSANGPVRIRNGSVRNWKWSGVWVQRSTVELDSLFLSENGTAGLELDRNVTARISNCIAEGNSNWGFRSLVTEETQVDFVNCTANGNVGGFGVGSGTLRGCVARRNTHYGFSVHRGAVVHCVAEKNGDTGIGSSGSTVQNCTVNSNGGDGIRAYGGVVQGCTISNNQKFGISAEGTEIQECTVTSNTQGGIEIKEGSVRNCTLRENYGHGIAVLGGSSQIAGNSAIRNGSNSGIYGSGIWAEGDSNLISGNRCSGSRRGLTVTGSLNRIEDNHLAGNSAFGLWCSGQLNIIIRNTARNPGGTNWSIGANNRAGTFVAPAINPVINGATGGNGSGTTDPFANLSF